MLPEGGLPWREMMIARFFYPAAVMWSGFERELFCLLGAVVGGLVGNRIANGPKT